MWMTDDLDPIENVVNPDMSVKATYMEAVESAAKDSGVHAVNMKKLLSGVEAAFGNKTNLADSWVMMVKTAAVAAGIPTVKAAELAKAAEASTSTIRLPAGAMDAMANLSQDLSP